MSVVRTARERARAEMTKEIKAVARRHLATDGAAGLSFRAVARDLDIASSAVYRYFATRDELLTALIVDAFDAVGEQAERAATRSQGQPARERWRAVARAVRTWALRHPNEWALVYGSPVPGYRAPEATIEPAARAPLALGGVVREAAEVGEWKAPASTVRVPAAVRPELATLQADLALDAGPLAEAGVGLAGELVLVWTQLFGLISFELFGHLHGVVDHNEAFFDAAVDQTADRLGLTPHSGHRSVPRGAR